MINILVVTHGMLGEGLIDSAKMLVGETEKVDFIPFTREMGQDQLDDAVEEKLNEIKDGEQVLFFCDILGGTPFKVCSKFAFKNENISVFYGVNLPVLIDAMISREGKTITEITSLLVDASQQTLGLSQI